MSTIAAARTIADNLNLKVIHALPGSDFLLSADNWDNFAIIGRAFQVNLAGRSVSGTSFQDCIVTGDDDGSNTIQTIYIRCRMGGNSLGLHRMENCGLAGTVTLVQPNATIDWIDCHSRVAGTTTPKVDFGTTTAHTNLNVRNYSGGIEVSQMGDTGTDNMSLEGRGQLIINSDCSGGTIAIRGAFTVTDNAAGAVTLSDGARYDVGQITSVVGTELAGLGVLPDETFMIAMEASINANTDGRIADLDIPQLFTDVATVDANVDTLVTELATAYGEPADAPGPSETMNEKIGYLYAALTNAITVSDSVKSYYKDGGTVLWTKALSDDGTTYTEIVN